MKTLSKKEDILPKILHELRSPTIAQIQALSTILYNNKTLNPKDKELIELTLNSCNDVQNLLDIFSLIYKQENEKLVLNFEKINISELIEAILKEKSTILKYYNLNYEFNNIPILVYCDKSHLKRTIAILLELCFQISFKNSKIIIQTETQKNNLIFQIKCHSDYIQEDVIKTFFDKNKSQIFFNNISLNFGLFLAKEIIHLHFGKMIAKSTEENISIFGFEIPLK